jgi:hypothetical protein
VVIVLPTGPKVRGFKPRRRPQHDFLREEVQTSAPCQKILRHVKDPYGWNRDTSSAKFKDISHQLTASLLGVSSATSELWWMNQE